MEQFMETICVSEFRSDMTKILKRIEAGEVVRLMLRGREVARLVPPDSAMEKARKSLRELRKTAFVGDVLSPLGEEWEARSFRSAKMK